VRAGEKVIAYDLYPSNHALRRLLNDDESRRIEIIRGDVLDLGFLLHALKDYNVERIVHLAYLLPTVAAPNPPLSVRVNCGGTVNVFEAARLLGLKKVFWASSISVFGMTDKYPQGEIPNDAPHYPKVIYGASKSFNEIVARFYSDHYNLDTVALRYGIVYGLGMERSRASDIVQELIEHPALGKPGRVPYGDSIINWLYVDDAAAATVLAAKSGRTSNRVFNISGHVRSVAEVAGVVRQLIPEADVALLPGDMANPYQFDTGAIERELGFRPQWPVERAVKDMLNTVRSEHGLSPLT